MEVCICDMWYSDHTTHHRWSKDDGGDALCVGVEPGGCAQVRVARMGRAGVDKGLSLGDVRIIEWMCITKMWCTRYDDDGAL